MLTWHLKVVAVDFPAPSSNRILLDFDSCMFLDVIFAAFIEHKRLVVF